MNRSRLLALAAMIAVSMGGWLGAQSGRASYRIAYAKPDGIYVSDRDGSGARLLVATQLALFPEHAWSPDGSTLAFFSFDQSDQAISEKCKAALHLPLYLVTIATGAKHRSTDMLVVPQIGWSADSSRIVFASGCEDPARIPAGTPGTMDGRASAAIYVLEVDTRTARRVTDFTGAGFPSWSPDGRSVAYAEKDGLYIMTAAGQGRRKLADGVWASWSPLGEWIAYVASPPASSPQGGPAGLFIIRPDGTGTRQLLAGVDPTVRWSPDGTKLIGPGNVMIDIASGARTELGKLVDLRFAPDGQSLLFSGENAIWSADLQGQNQKRVIEVAGPSRFGSFAVSPIVRSPPSATKTFTTTSGGAVADYSPSR